MISATIGVRQGTTTGCLLFVIYIDNLVRTMKSPFDRDGFLGMLLVMLLMDDTVILATSRDKCREKFDSLLDFCQASGMFVNEQKTKLFVINGTPEDRSPLHVRNMTVGYSPHYMYLGAHFTDEGELSSVIKLHAGGNSPFSFGRIHQCHFISRKRYLTLQ